MMSRTNSSAGQPAGGHPHRQGLLEQHSESVHPGLLSHCGGVSQWSVASGGRMVSDWGRRDRDRTAATVCTANCVAQNQVRGKAVVVDFPFPCRTRFVETRFFPDFVFP